MAIRVKFFASLRERVGRAELTLEPDSAALTVEDVWRLAAGDGARPNGILSAVNHEHATFAQAVNDGDEVAFFPPVTGG